MKRFLPILLVLLLSYWAVKPLLSPGFFPIHDNPQVVRVQQMAQALGDGQFPVRWVKDLGYGYGYPIFNFYAPLAYYFGGLFNLFGLNALAATKLMMIVGALLAGFSMYLLAREFWGQIGGVVAALFYVYAPYHAVDIYVRGAVGEYWAMAFLPLVFYGLIRQSVLISALGLAMVILSHNLTALMLIPFLLIAVCVQLARTKNKKRFIIHYSQFIILGLALSAFYWLPALSEMRLTKVFGQIGGGADFRDHFVYLDQLWTSDWGFGGSAPGRLDGMSFMIGKWHLLFAFLGLLVGIRRYQQTTFFVLFSLLFSLFLTNQISQPLWKAIPLMALIQYPWRFLVFASFFVSFLAGAVVWWLKNQWFLWFGGGLAILGLLFFNLKYFQPQTHFPATNDFYINEENIKWFSSRISDEYLPADFPLPQSKNEAAWEKVTVLRGEAKVADLVSKSNQTSFSIEAKTDAEILINTAYFPGWRVWVDGQENEFSLDRAKIKFSLPAGDHQVLLRLSNSSVRTAANLISFIAWSILTIFALSSFGPLRGWNYIGTAGKMNPVSKD